MKLKNALIIRLGNSGLANTTAHDLSGESAYKAFRFRRSVMKAYGELAERQAALKVEAGEDENRYRELNEALLKDETEVYASPIPVLDYLALASENRRTRVPAKGELYVDFFQMYENDLEGVLWEDTDNN